MDYLIQKHTIAKYNMEFIRNIWPTGFGAFCTERFFDDKGTVLLNVVYDCGAK